MTHAFVRMTLCLGLLASGSSFLKAQTSASSEIASAAPAESFVSVRQVTASERPARVERVAFGGGISILGINMQSAVNLSNHLNLRASGNFFNYEDKNISASGFTVDGRIKFAAWGTSLDYFPFVRHGFRISPGVLLSNQNAVSAALQAQSGTSFTLNNYTYYSSPSKPVKGIGSLGLHTHNPAPMITMGWGNMIPRGGGHWSFPVEAGVAYTGQPALNIAFTSGQVCADKQGTVNCQNVVGNKDVKDNLQAQVAKYERDLEPLRFTPILSVGASYSFRLP